MVAEEVSEGEEGGDPEEGAAVGKEGEVVEGKGGSIYHGGRFRQIRFKEIKEVLWQTGTGPSPLRLIVIAPTPSVDHKHALPSSLVFRFLHRASPFTPGNFLTPMSKVGNNGC